MTKVKNKTTWPNVKHNGPIKIHRDYKYNKDGKQVRRYSDSPFRAVYK
jgi:hypothetical protein